MTFWLGWTEIRTVESPRQNFFYVSDDGDIMAIRLQDWKVVLMEQRAKTLRRHSEATLRRHPAADCGTAATA